MNSFALAKLTISQVADSYRKGELSPVELTLACLERINYLNSSLNCLITVTGEKALEQAKRAERIFQRQRHLSHVRLPTLLGIPVVLKDLFETRGIQTTCGSKFFSDYFPTEDATVVKKLDAAGAIVLGKANMHEIALGVTNANPHFGICRNPWSLERSPGGSSGGSAVALAAGMCLGALGTDTGGSIRIPASLCGIVGLKPTRGRVSLRGVMPLSWNLDHAGPMARNVMDVALLLQVIQGYDAQDAYSVRKPCQNYLDSIRAGIHGWRVALAEDEFYGQAAPEVLSVVKATSEVFEKLGARVESISFPGAYQAAIANGEIVVADAATLHAERLQYQPEGFGADVLERLNTGAADTLSDYIRVRRMQVLLRRQFETFFEEYDILLTPTTPIVAPPILGPDAVTQARLLTKFTGPFNLTGLPALSLPCGFTLDGLPVGLQLISSLWSDEKVLRAAYAYEQATPWHKRTPVL